MNFRIAGFFSFLLLLIFLPGCEVIGGIFKAGMWVGILAVVIVIALLIWGIKALMSRD